ncbi:MAG: SRPBCC domain-containing protein [Thermoplasmata archaeon]
MNQNGRKETTDGERSAVRISRDFDFPRDAIFNMFTDSKKAAKFWGPEGAVKLVFELDPRPGGAIRIHDRNGEGVTHKTSGTILEIVVPELLVFRSATTPGEGIAPWEALQTVTFEELSSQRTRVTVLVKILETGSFPGGVESLEEGFQGGWGETLDMLQKELR